MDRLSQDSKASSFSAGQCAALFLALGLVGIAVLGVHWPALSCQALNFDDSEYLIDNVLVQNPSWQSVKRFFVEVLEPSTVKGYYQPLAMISLMLDYALGGRPDDLFVFHRTSLILHLISTVLLMAILYRVFKQVWVAAAVGLLFGLHPLTVEPICWVSDRKTILAAMFCFAAVWLYVMNASQPRWWMLLISCLLYGLALLSKPTSIPLFLVLFLLDYWPLRRFSWRSLLEKIPFIVLAVTMIFVTIVSQRRTLGFIDPSEVGFGQAVLVFCHNVIFYPFKIFYPAHLSSNYMYPEPLDFSHAMIAAGVYGSILCLIAALVSLRWTRALLAGWLIFLVLLFPTMGVVKFTFVIAADKFVYLPALGVVLALGALGAWIVQSSGRWSLWRFLAAGVFVICVVLEGRAARNYLACWSDTVTLNQHMVELTPNSTRVLYNLGHGYQVRNDLDKAVGHYEKILTLDGDYLDARSNLALILQQQGKIPEAVREYTHVLKQDPLNKEARTNLGGLLAMQGRTQEALEQYEIALRNNPSDPTIHFNLGVFYAVMKQTEKSLHHFEQALQLKPNYIDAHFVYGKVLLGQSDFPGAMAHFRQVIHYQPAHVQSHFFLGVLLQQTGETASAVKEFRETLRLNPDHAQAKQRLDRILDLSN